MALYINKDALVTEIEEKKRKISPNRDWYFDEYTNGYIDALKDILSFLDTFEMKDVDLGKEIQNIHKHFHDYYGIVNSDTGEFAKVEDMAQIAKYFYELGIKAQKVE